MRFGGRPAPFAARVRETFGSRYGGEEDGKALPPTVYVLHERLAELILRNQAAGRIDVSLEPHVCARLLLDVYYNENANGSPIRFRTSTTASRACVKCSRWPYAQS